MKNTIKNAVKFHESCKAVGFAQIMVDYAENLIQMGCERNCVKEIEFKKCDFYRHSIGGCSDCVYYQLVK
jgi:hypothetical protein